MLAPTVARRVRGLFRNRGAVEEHEAPPDGAQNLLVRRLIRRTKLTRGAEPTLRSGRRATDHRRGNSISTTSEYSCTCSSTSSLPSEAISKSRTSKFGAKSVT
jgi:hypothetical protein